MVIFKHRVVGILLVFASLAFVILLSLVKIDVDKQNLFACQLVSESSTLSMSECPAHKSNTSWFISGGFGLSFVVFLLGIYFIFSKSLALDVAKPEAQQTNLKKIDSSKLDEEERKVYEVIKQRQGSIYQSDLIKETGFSKVKVTRILDRLATKGIAERSRRGMTNIVVLK